MLPCIRSAVCFIFFLTEKSSGEASSAISSSESMHLFISLLTLVRGSRRENISDRLSCLSSSPSSDIRPYCFALAATESTVLTDRSSWALRAPDTSTLLSDSPISFIPENEGACPRSLILSLASEVLSCHSLMCLRSEEGFSLRQSSLPDDEVAKSASLSMILSYSSI